MYSDPMRYYLFTFIRFYCLRVHTESSRNIIDAIIIYWTIIPTSGQESTESKIIKSNACDRMYQDKT